MAQADAPDNAGVCFFLSLQKFKLLIAAALENAPGPVSTTGEQELVVLCKLHLNHSQLVASQALSRRSLVKAPDQNISMLLVLCFAG